MNDNSDNASRPARREALYAPSGMQLDKIDLAILRLLQTDARMTVQAIADQTGLSHSGALHRVNRINQSGAIVRHVALIEDTVFEVWPMLYVDITLTRAGRLARKDLYAAICAAPEIIEAVEIVGQCDMVLQVALPSPAHWTKLQDKLDPMAELIAEVQPRVIGKQFKPRGPHPLLEGD